MEGVLFFLILFFAVSALGCPAFVEFFPDPTLVSDALGEFIEIRLDKSDLGNIYGPESLKVHFDGKTPLVMEFPRTERLLLMHEGASCQKSELVTCGSLGNISLPNSRETVWLLEAGSCRDSVLLPVPKAGKSFQRVKESDEWVLTEATPGTAAPLYELNVEDCGIDGLTARYEGTENALWKIELNFSGCDSSRFTYQVENLEDGRVQRDSALAGESFWLQSLRGDAFRIRAEVPPDAAPSNNLLDTVVFVSGKFPLVITEVHHCPNEPEPEWVEVYNRGGGSIPLDKIRFCGRGGFWGDSLEGGGSLVISKDTAALLEFLGFRDVYTRQVALGFLNNTAGSLSVCYGDQVLDSVGWDKSTVACPLGFNPQTRRAENTPGYQSARSRKSSGKMFSYKISSRIIRKNKGPLLVYIESDYSVVIKLLDSAGRSVWTQNTPPQSNTWWKIPADTLLEVGVGYLSISSGREEQSIGILVRP